MATNETKPDFQEALKDFLQEHGKTMADLSLASPSPPQPEPPVVTPEGVQETIVKHVVSSSTVQRRKLRLFSGRTPVPNGEIDFDAWIRPAQQVVDDTELAEPEKLSRILEALLPPASKIVWALGSGATAKDCIDGLEKAYGTTADAEELYLQVCQCFQKDGEAASEFLLRLQDRITKAEDRGAIEESRAGSIRMSQFLRGCLYNDALLVALDLRGRNPPPSFVQLLHEVRTEEHKQMEKEERRKATTKPAKKPANVRTQSVECDDKGPDRDPMAEQVKELRDVVASLQQQLQLTKQVEGQRAPSDRPNRPRRFPLLCFNCGEFGHRLDRCNQPTNPTLVQKRMAERYTNNSTQGNGQGQM